MTVVFVAPDDSDDEDMSNCDVENHLKYKFITDETEHNPRTLSLSETESIRRVRNHSTANGNNNDRQKNLEHIDRTDTVSIDSSQKDGPSVIDRYLKHTRQYLPVKRTDSKE